MHETLCIRRVVSIGHLLLWRENGRFRHESCHTTVLRTRRRLQAHKDLAQQLRSATSLATCWFLHLHSHPDRGDHPLSARLSAFQCTWSAQ